MGNVRTGVGDKEKSNSGKVVVGTLRTVALSKASLDHMRQRKNGAKVRVGSRGKGASSTATVVNTTGTDIPSGTARIGGYENVGVEALPDTGGRAGGLTPESGSSPGALRNLTQKAGGKVGSITKKSLSSAVSTANALTTSAMIQTINGHPSSGDETADKVRKSVLLSYAVPTIIGKQKVTEAIIGIPGGKRQKKLIKKEKKLVRREERLEKRISKREERIGRLKQVSEGSMPRPSGRKAAAVSPESQRRVRERAGRKLAREEGRLERTISKTTRTGKRLARVRVRIADNNFFSRLLRWILGILLSLILAIALIAVPFLVSFYLIISNIEIVSGPGTYLSFMAFTGDSLTVRNYLEGKGMNDIQMAAIIGEMCVLTTGNPGTLDAGATGPNGGVGIMQWTGERKEYLETFCRNTGTTWQDIDAQLDFFWLEYTSWLNIASFESAADLEQAVELFDRVFATEDIDKRADFTLESVRYAASRAYSTLTFQFEGDERLEFYNGAPYYNQGLFWDVPFNNYGEGNEGNSVQSDGCGISSFSMVATAYTGLALSPAVTAPWAMANGANTVLTWDSFYILAQNYGISTVIQGDGPYYGGSPGPIIEALSQGYMVIGSQTGGVFNSSGSGHYIVYVGITPEGYILVNDPGSRERTAAGAYPQAAAFANCKQYWIFKP